MLALYAGGGPFRDLPRDLATAALPPGTFWIDLLQPKPVETAFVERTTGVSLPSFEALAEIESSSRLRIDGNVLYLSAPLVYRATANEPQATPVGFILTRERLITIRFEA